jgi:hypothetical protein
LYSRWGFAGVAYNFCFSIVSLAKKIAFSLRIHSKTDGLLHSRCGFAVVALKIHIFSALTKGTYFSGVSLAINNCILAGVLQGLPIISAFQLFRWQKKSHSRCGSIAKQMGFCILAAVLQWWHSKFTFFLH